MYYSGDNNRTSEWVNKVFGLIAEDMAEEVNSTLKTIVDSYEYEKIAFPEGEAPLKTRIRDWFSGFIDGCSYTYLGSEDARNMLIKVTEGVVTYEVLSDRAKKEIDLIDRLCAIQVMATGKQEETKRIEKVLFDDDGSYFRRIFRQIAGGEASITHGA